MADRPTDDAGEANGEAPTEAVEEARTEAAELAPVTSQYKVLGELTDASGVGVLGQNDAASGTPVGVQGAVPNADEGYGLFTPDDVSVGGMLETGYLGASVYHSSEQTIYDTNRTAVEFDSELYDDGSEFDNASTPHAFSPDVGGTYHVESKVSFENVLSSNLNLDIRVATHLEARVSRTDTGTVSVSKVLRIPAGDSVTIELWQNSGSPQDLNGGRYFTYATFTRMG